MKIAPKSVFLLFVLALVIYSCRYQTKEPLRLEPDQKINAPEEKSLDSSKLKNPGDESFPNTTLPRKAKKKSGTDLDTLRPIKA